MNTLIFGTPDSCEAFFQRCWVMSVTLSKAVGAFSAFSACSGLFMFWTDLPRNRLILSIPIRTIWKCMETCLALWHLAATFAFRRLRQLCSRRVYRYRSLRHIGCHSAGQGTAWGSFVGCFLCQAFALVLLEPQEKPHHVPSQFCFLVSCHVDSSWVFWIYWVPQERHPNCSRAAGLVPCANCRVSATVLISSGELQMLQQFLGDILWKGSTWFASLMSPAKLSNRKRSCRLLALGGAHTHIYCM